MKRLPRDFWLLCASTLIFVLSFNLILPELNHFLELIGEGENKWAALLPWTISAMLLRPLSGKMSDVVGRKFVIYFGLIVNIGIAFFYPVVSALSLFFLVRLIHGFSVGFQPTGASILAADLIPEDMRGEAMGFFSIAISLGFGLGSFLGYPIKEWLGLDGLFYSVAFFGLIATLITLPVRETQTRKKQFKVTDVIPRPDEIIAPEVFVPAIIMTLITVCTGFYFLLIPEISLHLEVENKGLFFTTHMLSGLVVRYLAGRLSDRIGRRKALLLGVFTFACATTLMIFVQSVALFFICGFLYGIGTAIISPTTMAWATDLSIPSKKGRGLGTLWMGLEFGLMVGTYFGMLIYQNDMNQVPLIFTIAAVILFLIALYLATLGKKARVRYEEPLEIHE